MLVVLLVTAWLCVLHGHLGGRAPPRAAQRPAGRLRPAAASPPPSLPPRPAARRSRPVLRAAPDGSSPMAPPPPAAFAAAGCARARRGHLLVYAAHSGFGNQELALRRAVLIAYVLNRTLVLPPLLRQSDLSFGPPDVRCRQQGWQGRMQARAEALYSQKLADASGGGGGYESLADIYGFGEVRSLGLPVVDYAALPVRTRERLSASPLAPLGCAQADRHARTLGSPAPRAPSAC